MSETNKKFNKLLKDWNKFRENDRNVDVYYHNINVWIPSEYIKKWMNENNE